MYTILWHVDFPLLNPLPPPLPPPPYTVCTSPYPLIPELRECVHSDTEHNVQSNGGHNNEEGDVIE